ncbi:hypothetical protein NXV73_19650 [Bacteroides salyersiae]|nr:hypothetical protein [Bacteroides salyersiae]MCS3284190.1 hypothetical protein [Bacteroides salyersiae]UBD64706.1 hypothetical protein K6V25_17675 [Bacteroides salyersiae]
MGTTVNIQASADCEVYLLSLNRLSRLQMTVLTGRRRTGKTRVIMR